MKLPQVSYADGIKTAKQDEFAGLNHNLGAKDGELWDMRNLCSDYHPLLATRQRRMLYKTLQAPGGLFCWDKLCWVDGTTFYYDGAAKGTVTAGQKTFTALGVYIVIFPDKAWYNTLTGEFGSLEATWAGSSLTFTNGKLYEEDAEANCIQASRAKKSTKTVQQSASSTATRPRPPGRSAFRLDMLSTSVWLLV